VKLYRVTMTYQTRDGEEVLESSPATKNGAKWFMAELAKGLNAKLIKTGKREWALRGEKVQGRLTMRRVR